MSVGRRAASRDANEREMVEAARSEGAHVSHLSGAGIPDLLLVNPGPDVPVFVCETVEQILEVVRRNPISLVEVKMPGKKLTRAQAKWHKEIRQ